MKVLLAASEVAPFIKIGGLGDVIGSLPRALQELDVNADVAVPFYPKVQVNKEDTHKTFEIQVPYDGETHLVEIFTTKLPSSDVDVLLFKNDDFFSEGGKSAFLNNISETEMFAFFNRAVVEYIKTTYNLYDLVHCHDWHTGLITHILKEELEESRPATLFTIHNLMYQGVGHSGIVKKVGLNSGQSKLLDWDIADGDINMMLQGITSSDFVNTVSEAYAKEILTKEYGGIFNDVLKAREGRLVGILNGIDYSLTERHFSIDDWQEGKLTAKNKLYEELLPECDKDATLFSYIGRLDPGQKGLDVLYDSIPHIMKNNASFVLLGVGDPAWEKKFVEIEKKYAKTKKIACKIVFDPDLADRIYSASDFLLVPSKYEPCGLIQIIAMYHGTIPVVRETGGLKDTVKDGINGVVFEDYSAKALRESIDRSLEIIEDENLHKEMVETNLRTDHSWKSSAEKYVKLYERVVEIRNSAKHK